MGAERQNARVRPKLRVEINRRDLYGFAARRGHRVKVRPWQLIIWFVDLTRSEINLRAVLGPNRVFLIESASGQLARFHFFFSTLRRGHDPDVRRVLWIDVTFLFFPIYSSRDAADVVLSVASTMGLDPQPSFP